MRNKLIAMAENKTYWISLLLLGIALELAALFYQYVLDYYPCVLCIHVRIWVLGIILVSALALSLRKYRNTLPGLHAVMTILFAAMFERSYMLLGTERGFVFGDCNMDLGLPGWLALDSWLPAVFKVWEACGYTPVLVFGVTMAEALFVMSAGLLLLSAALTLLMLRQRFQKQP